MEHPNFFVPKKQTEKPSTSPAKARPLPEVEIVSQSNRLLDRYRELYKVRYGVEPILPNIGIANTQTKDLIRKVGMERASSLIEHYLKSNGDNDWYLRTGHSLKTFENKIEEINAQLGLLQKRNSPDTSDYNPMITFNSQCPLCKNWHDITCRGIDAHKYAYTVSCRACEAGSQ